MSLCRVDLWCSWGCLWSGTGQLAFRKEWGENRSPLNFLTRLCFLGICSPVWVSQDSKSPSRTAQCCLKSSFVAQRDPGSVPMQLLGLLILARPACFPLTGILGPTYRHPTKCFKLCLNSHTFRVCSVFDTGPSSRMLKKWTLIRCVLGHASL